MYVLDREREREKERESKREEVIYRAEEKSPF